MHTAKLKIVFPLVARSPAGVTLIIFNTLFALIAAK
jgi:hypothetical protein